MSTLKAYQCGFCLKNLKAPITLPCGHNVCRDCWYSLHNKCPSCSQVYPDGVRFEVNAALDKAIQELLSLSASNHQEDDSLHIDFNELKILDELGEGAFGRVYKCVWRDTECAVKMLLHNDFSSDAAADFEKEIFIMKKLRHPNIVLFMGACTEPKRCLITEFMGGGSLWDELRKNGRPDRLKGLKIAFNIARGMRALHSMNILHRDLKSKNVLLDDHGTAKIADFGLSKVKTETMRVTCGLGTPQWMSPESLQPPLTVGMPSDVYAFGVVMWEIITGLIPFDGFLPMQVGMQVVFGKRPSFPEDINMEDDWVKLIERSWAQQPEDRPSFSDCIVELERLVRQTGGSRSLSFNVDDSNPSVQGLSTFLDGLGIHQPEKIVAPGIFSNVVDDDLPQTPNPTPGVVRPGIFLQMPPSPDGSPQQAKQPIPIAPPGLFSDFQDDDDEPETAQVPFAISVPPIHTPPDSGHVEPFPSEPPPLPQRLSSAPGSVHRRARSFESSSGAARVPSRSSSPPRSPRVRPGVADPLSPRLRSPRFQGAVPDLPRRPGTPTHKRSRSVTGPRLDGAPTLGGTHSGLADSLKSQTEELQSPSSELSQAAQLAQSARSKTESVESPFSSSINPKRRISRTPKLEIDDLIGQSAVQSGQLSLSESRKSLEPPAHPNPSPPSPRPSKVAARPLPPRPIEVEQQKSRLLASTTTADMLTAPSTLDKLLMVAQQRSGSDPSVPLSHTDSSNYDSSDDSFGTASSNASNLRSSNLVVLHGASRMARCANCKSSFDIRHPLGCTKGEPGEGPHMARCTRCKKDYDVRRAESCWFHKTNNSLKGLLNSKCMHCKRSLNEIGCQRADNHEPRS